MFNLYAQNKKGLLIISECNELQIWQKRPIRILSISLQGSGHCFAPTMLLTKQTVA